MTRSALLGLVALALVAAFALTRGSGQDAPSANVREAHPAVLPTAPLPSAVSTTAAPSSARNVFEYAANVPADAAPRFSVHLAPPPTTLPEPPVRLLGIVSSGAGRRAALAINGEVVVLTPGKSALGYTLLSVDEDSGAHLRGPDGAELQAAPRP